MSTENSIDEISVPPQLVQVLKEYTKAVVREKPSDLLLWSAIYFRTLARGQSPETKERLYIFDPAAGGLSEAVIRLIYLKLKENERVIISDLKTLWKELGLDSSLLLELLNKSGVSQEEESEVNWMKILVLATAVISENIKDTMKKFLEVACGATSEPRMSLLMVEEIFHFLAEVNDVPSSDIQDVLQYLRDIGAKQGGYIYSSNFQDSAFPNL